MSLLHPSSTPVKLARTKMAATATATPPAATITVSEKMTIIDRSISLTIDHVPTTLLPPRRRVATRDKVVFVVGATGTGKSKLAIDVAASFAGEIVNSDKMQVYEGLDVVTNKVTPAECGGVPHHLIGFLQPDADFTTSDFRRKATTAVEEILARGKLPVVAGGSNTYVEALVDERFRSRFDCCFLWVDVRLPTLDRFVSERVDRMVDAGLVEEVRRLFDPLDADYTRGLRRAIGVPEMDGYLRVEAAEGAGSAAARCELDAAVAEVKRNTCRLVRRQLEKIDRLRGLPGWHMERVDATEALGRRGSPRGSEAWERLVSAPALETVLRFLGGAGNGVTQKKRLLRHQYVVATR